MTEWDGNGPAARATEWDDETDTAAFHHDGDLTGTFRFLATFFIVTLLAAAAFIGGTIALIGWLTRGH